MHEHFQQEDFIPKKFQRNWYSLDELARLVATAGQLGGFGEGNLSERIAPNTAQNVTGQTQPYTNASVGESGYITSPIPLDNMNPGSGDYAPYLPAGTTPPTSSYSGGSSGGSSSVSSNGFEGILGAADQARRDAIARATENYNIGRSIYDQGLNTLGTRRKQFEELFSNTQGDILTGYEKNRGEMQSSASGEATRSANALRALGLGGSAVINSQGRQAQENARSLGSLQESRTASDRANATNKSEQDLWANSQEGALGTYLQQLGSQKSLAESGAGTDYSNLLGNVASQIAALQAARGNIDSYSANPISVDPSAWLSSVNNANT